MVVKLMFGHLLFADELKFISNDFKSTAMSTAALKNLKGLYG